MEIHERFMSLPTEEINVLAPNAGSRDDEPRKIRELVEAHNAQISNNNILDLDSLETFRILLCYQYQSLIHSRIGDEPLACQDYLCPDLMNLFIKNKEIRKTQEFAVLYDIIVLQLVVSTKPLLRQSFKGFWATRGLLSNTQNVDLALRVSECYADSYTLHTYLHKLPHDSAELSEDLTHIMRIIQLWIRKKKGVEWKLLRDLLPKLVLIFEPQDIICPLWRDLFGSSRILLPFTGREFNEIHDLQEKLTVLCVLATVCFPLEKDKVKECHYQQCLQDEFWCILNRGLMSKFCQQRRQALYLIKRALEFVEVHKLEIKSRLRPLKKSAVLFICTDSEDKQSLLEEVKKNFLLILEVLEEKQQQLVIPVLWHLQSLEQVRDVHKFCCDCFSPIWLRCVYRRIVHHDNESVKIFGLLRILKSDPLIFFDDEFLLFFVAELNNPILYEYNYEEARPQIVKELEATFFRWEQMKLTFVNSFVRALPSVDWCTFAIYWILQALFALTDQCKIVNNVWGEVELHCVDELIQGSLLTDDWDIRTFSQILIIRSFVAYTPTAVNASAFDRIFSILSSICNNKHFGGPSTERFQVVEHLSKIINPSDAEEYVTHKCERMFTTPQNLKTLATGITFLAESDLIFRDDSCLAYRALANLFENLTGADVHADEDVILKVLEFTGHLLIANVCPRGYVISVKINSLIDAYIDLILEIVRGSFEVETISKYDEYLLVITNLLKQPGFSGMIENLRESNAIEAECIKIIVDRDSYSKNKWFYAIKMLYIWSKDIGYLQGWQNGIDIIPRLVEYLKSRGIDTKEEANVAQASGKPEPGNPCDCPVEILQLLHVVIRAQPSFLDNFNVEWIRHLRVFLEIGNEQVVGPIAGILNLILGFHAPLPPQTLDFIKSMVLVSWRIVFGLDKTAITIDLIMELISIITGTGFLCIDPEREYTTECIAQITEKGDSAPLLKTMLLQNTTDLTIICTSKIFMSYILHGTVHPRNQRIEYAAIAHGHKLSNERDLALLNTNSDVAVRSMSITYITAFGDEPEDVQKEILRHLLEILEENKDKRYCANSNLHMVKQRVMQTLLVQECILKEPQRQKLHDTLCDLLTAETNQPSVRLMHEWLLIKLHLKNADMRESMWKLFDTAAEKRAGSIVSLASIVFHVARKLSGETQKEYINKAISRLMPSCGGQQTNARLYSEAIISEIYDMLPRDSLAATTHENIFQGVNKGLCRGNSLKNSSKVLDDFYFTSFDPILDFNLETIYNVLPRLTNVSTEELIPTAAFNQYFCSDVEIPKEARSVLRNATPYLQSSKATDSGTADIQKKMIPWNTMIPFYDDLSEITKARLRRKPQNEDEGIIIVASLIDRSLDLGGIARTCEMFGAKELIIGNQKQMYDREFQTVSVSTDKWTKITEVKPQLLQKYLMEKQAQGWKLVSVEQRTNNTNLLEIVLPKKTLLVLGNEREGIPANLVLIMDLCVDMPQYGVVRAMNVQETSAICIWLYVRQHVFT